MNAVEIEEAISKLAEEPFDADEFPYAFLEAFGNRETTIKRLRSGSSNRSDLGGVLQTNNIHIKTCAPGTVTETLAALRASRATTRARAKFILATDGQEFHAEDLNSGEVVVCDHTGFPDHFGFFLPLAGISTVRQISESAADIKAAGLLNRLYVAILNDNPDWGTAARGHDMNHFMARLIFCFFAEDIGILGDGLFTGTVDQMSAGDGSNAHDIIAEIFRAMGTRAEDRAEAAIARWADAFPHVNGGLFSGSVEVPRFSKAARSYLLHIGALDWKKINPDIFGSMIQAVADEDERGALGMHYTSVPNILKVLNPLFLDDLRGKLEEAGGDGCKLLNLRKRMARIRVFDPACGSGNFLVIAYKQMREIEAEINKRRGEEGRRSGIPIQNFRGIELRDFSAEIARLALIIAKHQCDVIWRGQKEARGDFLPFDSPNWITCGNALRLDWLSICPPTGTGVKHRADDLFMLPVDHDDIDFENEGGETYICGNPPYLGSTWQSPEQKEDLRRIFDGHTSSWKSLDYVAGWFMKAADYGRHTPVVTAFVATNSICQGRHVPILWTLIFAAGHEIAFAHTNFKWANIANHNARVTVVIIGISNHAGQVRRLYSPDGGKTIMKEAAHINAYLVAAPNVIVSKSARPLADVAEMRSGHGPIDGGNFLMTASEVSELGLTREQEQRFIRRIYGSAEFIRGIMRFCLCIDDQHLEDALAIPALKQRIDAVRAWRLASRSKSTNAMSKCPHRFGMVRQQGTGRTIVVPGVSSENRDFLPVGLINPGDVISARCYAIYDAPLWNLRDAHERNDETLEHIYIGRRFRDDSERLEKLFEMYTRMTRGKAA